MPDTYACICVDLYHTSIAMCLCSFIGFARALFLNAEFPWIPCLSTVRPARCKGCMSFSSWHCTRHSFVGKSLIPKDTQNDTVLTFPLYQTSPLLQPPNFRGSAFSFKRVCFNWHILSMEKMPGSLLQWCCCICCGFGWSLCLVSQWIHKSAFDCTPSTMFSSRLCWCSHQSNGWREGGSITIQNGCPLGLVESYLEATAMTIKDF